MLIVITVVIAVLLFGYLPGPGKDASNRRWLSYVVIVLAIAWVGANMVLSLVGWNESIDYHQPHM